MGRFLLFLFGFSLFAYNAVASGETDKAIRPIGIEAFFVFPNDNEIFLGGQINKSKLLTADRISARVQFATEDRNPDYDTLKYVTQSFKMYFVDVRTGESIILNSNSDKITNEMKEQMMKNDKHFYVANVTVLGLYDGKKRMLPAIEVFPK